MNQEIQGTLLSLSIAIPLAVIFVFFLWNRREVGRLSKLGSLLGSIGSDSQPDRILERLGNSSLKDTAEQYRKTIKIKAQSLFLCDGSFLTYFLLLASMILRKKYSSSG